MMVETGTADIKLFKLRKRVRTHLIVILELKSIEKEWISGFAYLTPSIALYESLDLPIEAKGVGKIKDIQSFRVGNDISGL
jgi:hypothetical protein